MKKRLVTYLLVTALAAAVFAGCSKKDAGDAADAAATGATAIEEAAEAATAAAEVAAAEETAALEGTAAAAEEVATEEVAAEEVAAPEEEAAAVAVEEEEADKEEADTEDAEKEEEYLVVDPGTQYTVRFGGNIYSTPEEIAENIMYFANPGDYLNVVERLDDFWYKVTYYLAGEGIEHTGYIQIQ